MDWGQASIEPVAATAEGGSETHPYGYGSLVSRGPDGVRRS